MTPTRLLAPLLFFLVAAAGPVPRPTVEVQVLRDGGVWTADYSFDRASPVWVFARSAMTREGQMPWRPQSWRVETPGVRLERRGRYDILVAERGPVPRKVRIRFTPFTADLLADYVPALAFSDGSVALYNEHFHAFPLGSRAEAARLPVDLNGFRVSGVPTRATFRDTSGPVLHAGRRIAAATPEKGGAYILFGAAKPIESEAVSTIVDPGLPAWIRESLAFSTREILSRYAAALGPGPAVKPTFMVSWAGPTPRKISMSGSVLPGLVVMTFEGEGVVAEHPALRNQARWFIAHETAHFWLGEAVRYEHSRDAWITEGGADLLAIRTVAEIDPAYDARAELHSAISDCAKLTKGRGVASAEQRNEHRAYYACGAVFALVAEAASKTSFAAWLRPLIDANRADRFLGRAEWLAALDRSSGDPRLSAAIARLLDRGADNPKAAIAALFELAGVPHSLDPDGTPRLLEAMRSPAAPFLS